MPSSPAADLRSMPFLALMACPAPTRRRASEPFNEGARRPRPHGVGARRLPARGAQLPFLPDRERGEGRARAAVSGLVRPDERGQRQGQGVRGQRLPPRAGQDALPLVQLRRLPRQWRRRLRAGADRRRLDLWRLDREHRPHDPRGSAEEEHTSELQSRQYLVCRLLLEKKKKNKKNVNYNNKKKKKNHI